ncbi:Fis family transcriptional regulator [Corchorus olitorius]|uniref:Fis family transcriptional regulator n=1 Tax=Corchorus olitorius TaxID=93759 RepID=A0A1R3I0Z2_9ROSI|nr:Fis family transcriptional regulator [Corchorus olitorius]
MSCGKNENDSCPPLQVGSCLKGRVGRNALQLGRASSRQIITRRYHVALGYWLASIVPITCIALPPPVGFQAFLSGSFGGAHQAFLISTRGIYLPYTSGFHPFDMWTAAKL